MRRGEFVETGTPEVVFGKPLNDYTKMLLAAVPDVKRALQRR
jgi:ABC-type glutathione transport system ATPase component